PHFGCCTSNMHQGWPKLTSQLWMSDGEGGVAAVSYAPCAVTAEVGDGARLQLKVDGDYPFRAVVCIELALDRTASFAISLRIPGWCESPSLTVNGETVALQTVNGYAKVAREWSNGDALRLQLPMTARMVNRHLCAVSVERGPLVYALPIK